MEIAGYIAAALIGVSLGLIGGGGSILTVPVLVYLFTISPAVAISYSLFIVGLTSLIGAINYHRKGYVHFRTVLLFGSSSIVTVFLTRKLIIPLIPDILFTIGSYSVTHSLVVMIAFAILMLFASASMIKDRQNTIPVQTKEKPIRLLAYGILIGIVTGFLGAGGGFLLIPTLVLFMRLPMKQAVGTSLLIIALNSLGGFIGDLGEYKLDWKFLITVTTVAGAGIFVGGYFNGKLNGEKLKKGFGWFVLMMGIYILGRELL